MDILQIIMLTMHLTHTYAHKSRNRKYDKSSSDETIENLLYFKDCQRKPKEQTTSPTPLPVRALPPPPPPPQPTCPFPKMCCSISCENESGGNKEPSFMSRQQGPLQNIQRHQNSIQPISQMMPRQFNMMSVQPQIRKRKKMKFPTIPTGKMQLPIGSGRRNFGLTKEKIKSLILQDDDIKKILKDLVRVTMQKVDVLDMINGRRSENATNETGEPTITTPELIDEDYVE